MVVHTELFGEKCRRKMKVQSDVDRYSEAHVSTYAAL